MDQLSFTAQQIEAVLDDFIKLLADDVFITFLKTSGQSEFAIVSQLIEDRQRKILEDHGVGMSWISSPLTANRSNPRPPRYVPNQELLSQRTRCL